ncbi:MAG: hypothetical protein ABI239_08960 [Aquihabitans sp.]
MEKLGVWPARLLWVVLALVAGPVVGDALDGRSTAVRVVVAVGLWVGWGAGAVALLVPRSAALTALRILVPAGLAAVLAAMVTGGPVDGFDAAAVAIGALATVAVLVPWVGEAWVDGSSYGPEHRLPLRPSPLVGFVLVPLTWAVVVAGAAAGPLLLATGQWLAGIVVLALGWGAAFAGVRSLHQLSRRWVVFVPSGLVIHDALVMPEPQLILRHMITNLGPALADTEATDLTGGAAGLILQIDLAEPLDLLLREGRAGSTTSPAAAILFMPTRPLRVLEAASRRRIPVG